MITIKFEADSVSALHSIIAEYLGSTPVAKPTKSRTDPAKAAEPSPKDPDPVKEPDTTAISIEAIRDLVLKGGIPKQEVKKLLAEYKVERITDVAETDYPEFYEKLSLLKPEE